jgi:flavodoxin
LFGHNLFYFLVSLAKSKSYIQLKSNIIFVKGLLLKSLVIYYTRSGNARFVAQTIAAEIGADIEEVVDLKKRSGILGWLSGGRDARQGKETNISSTTKLPVDYELIIVGTPVWAGKPTPAINTYLKKNDLSGKKVAAYFTQGQKKSKGIQEIKALVPNSEWVGDLSIISPLNKKEEVEKQIADWCKTLTSN